MRVLFCGGNAHAGSWMMRGAQIAACRHNWDAINRPTPKDIATADLVVVVKNINPETLSCIHEAKKPVVWDALDFWKQPEEALGVHTVADARELARRRIDIIRPQAVITANRAMAADLQGLAEVVQCIYHHCRLDLPAKVGGKTMCYDGSQKYPGLWIAAAGEFLASIGWRISQDKPSSDTGALFAVRDSGHGSWLARRWKSNVKAANAIALGVPFVAWPEQSYIETVPAGMGLWFTTQTQLVQRIASLRRGEILDKARKAAMPARAAFQVYTIAAQYEKLFDSLQRRL